MAGKEVAKKETGTEAALYDYGEFDGAGFEGQTKDDYAIPFIGVLQPMSPQLDELEDAKAGMVINTVTNDVYKGTDGVAFIPCLTQHVYVEWVPREQGGGIVGVHTLGSDLVRECKANQDFGKYVTPEGNDLIETFYVYGILVKEDGASEQVVIAFSSTKIKKYKQWMTKARTIQVPGPGGRRITPPLFAHRYRLKTVKEKNKKGEFWNWSVAFDGPDASACRLAPTDPLFQEAVGCASMVKSGEAKADYSSQATAGEGAAEDDGQDIPF